MPQDDKSVGARFLAFWSSLPGVLTGVAAVIAAVGTLAALFTGGHETGSAAPDAVASAVGAEPSAVPGAAGEDCFRQYFKGIPSNRLGTVEAGGYDDVLSPTERKAGPIGMTLTDSGLVGGIRFAYFPANVLFKIESIVDAHCRPVEDYLSGSGGDKHVWQDSTRVNIRLGDHFYDLVPNGGGSIVRVAFERGTRG